MKIKIIAVELSSATDKKGKPYQIVEVSFKNLTFNKVESRKIMPFGTTADTNKLLGKAQAGEFYEVVVVKNDAGLTFFELNKAKMVSAQAVLELAKEFENYVFGIVSSPSAPGTSFEDMEDDIPV